MQALVLALLQAVTIPPPTGLVNDFAGVVPAENRDRITRLAETVRRSSPGEIAVVTLADIGERDPAEIALRIGRDWGVGKQGAPGDPTRNAGVVILVVPKETSSTGRGRCRIEVGRGAEGFITDATAGEICREATPAFIARDYGTGVELLTARVAERFAREFGFSLGAASVPARDAPPGGNGFPWWVVAFALVLLVMFIQAGIESASNHGVGPRKRRRSRRGLPLPIIFPFPLGRSGGRGSGGGFGGFGGGGGFGGFGGGGGFSGGGGGSSW